MLSLLPSQIYTADAVTRRDLVSKALIDERAYIASWMARTRDLWRYIGLSSYAVTLQPPTKYEIKYGVDAVVVVKVHGLMKFFAFEAKRPGMGVSRDFDRKKKGAVWSRFSQQIMRQNALQKMGWVTGALFLDERPQNSALFDPLGSTFVPHADLVTTLPAMSGKAWKAKDVRLLAGSKGISVMDVLRQLVICVNGTPTSEERAEQALINLLLSSDKLTDLEKEFGVESDTRTAAKVLEEFAIPMAVPMIFERSEDGSITKHEKFLTGLLHATGAYHGAMFVVDEVEPELWSSWEARNRGEAT